MLVVLLLDFKGVRILHMIMVESTAGNGNG